MTTQTPTRDGTVLLTPGDAARVANVSRDTIYREIERGALPVRHVGRQLRIDPFDFPRLPRARERAMTATTESPGARLYAAGFTRQLDFWLSPDGHRVLNLGDVIAALDSGEIQPGGPTITVPETGVRAFPDELVDRICPPPQPAGEPPAWLMAQAQVIAAATVAKLKPLIRAECDRAVRAALRNGGES
jgi:excisionase family DNA binding protein